MIDYNPAIAVKIPKGQPQTTRRALTEEEQSWINETPHRARLAAMIMMHTGLRRGELIPLVWNDIDFVEQTITISKSVEAISNRFELKVGAKTEAGERIVPIPDTLLTELKRERRKNNSIYVVYSAKGAMHTPSSWKRLWSSYLTDLNVKYGIQKQLGVKATSKYNPTGTAFLIPRITPHWLRHTYATNLYLAGVDVLSAQEWLGHADVQTTLEVYTHLSKKHKKQNAEKLNAFLHKKQV